MNLLNYTPWPLHSQIAGEESGNLVKVEGNRKEKDEIPRTPSRSRGRKNVIEQENEEEKVWFLTLLDN